ncbi:MAG TPA: GntR family transcriptional regulator [Spirochaetales bacterium]|nr:GntR family transcriptional regulator [Spirochaetales bacterium]
MTESSGTKRLKRTVLSEQIKEQLMEDIFHKKYKEGDRIVESALARELGVSQASVREALRSLIAMGFLENEPFKGITVRLFTAQDLMEVITVRVALETLAGQLAVKRITDAEIDELQKIVAEMIQASERGDVEQRIHFNILFHEKLVEASGNKLLVQLYRYMRFGNWSLLTGHLSEMDPVEISSRHRLLLDALRSRDPDKATNAIRNHIESTSIPISELLARDNNGNSGTTTGKK